MLDLQSSDWERLSWVGQTYGAASALLSVMALIGIAVSPTLQARESKASREQALRAIHTELLQMAMDDEVYRRCWGPFFSAGDPTAQREHMYVNLIVSNWQMRYEMRAISEEHLRASAHIVFSGEIGRRFWAEGRELRLKAVSSRREHRFHQVLDEEHRHALDSPAQSPPPSQGPAEAATRRRVWPLLTILGGSAVAGAVPIVRRAVLRRRQR
jgi:hypothetical protein